LTVVDLSQGLITVEDRHWQLLPRPQRLNLLAFGILQDDLKQIPEIALLIDDLRSRLPAVRFKGRDVVLANAQAMSELTLGEPSLQAHRDITRSCGSIVG